MTRRVAAYVLAGDPAWTDVSVRSYYPLVNRIVVSYDERGLSWKGKDLDVSAAIEKIRAVDVDKKVDLLPGCWDAGVGHAIEAETRQRQAALDEAGRGADWVVQLDGDEVLTDLKRFGQSIERADQTDKYAVLYPQRWVYARVSGSLFLARSRRWWGALPTYEGAQVVRPDVRLEWARRIPASTSALYVTYARKGVAGDPDRIRPSQSVAHLSWVRTEQEMRRKAAWSGHAEDAGYDWEREIDKWQWRSRHPIFTVALTPLRHYHGARFALTRIPSLGRE